MLKSSVWKIIHKRYESLLFDFFFFCTFLKSWSWYDSYRSYFSLSETLISFFLFSLGASHLELTLNWKFLFNYSLSLSLSLSLYIYIYIMSSPDRLFRCITTVFSVSKPAKCFKLISKPSWLYVSRISYPRAIVILNVNERNFTYIFLHICYRLPECSIHQKSYCILVGRFLAWVFNPRVGA